MHQPSFRVVVTPKGLGGPKAKPVEELGWMNPLLKKFSVNKDRILYWMGQGAKPSPTVHNILVKAGIVKADKIAKHTKVQVKPGAEAPKAA